MWNASICTSGQEQYDGDTAVVDFNLPLNLKWDTDLGVVYATVSNSTTFSPVLCTNLEGSILRSSCNFTYSSTMGPNIYIKITANNEGNIQYTTGVYFLETTARTRRVIETRLSAQEINRLYEDMACPTTAADVEGLVPVVMLDEPGMVQTGHAAYYSFAICESKSTGPDFGIEIVVTGVEASDAFSTYVCNALPCAPNSGNVIASDTNDSTINIVGISYRQLRPGDAVYAAIVGFGGKQDNNFNFQAVLLPLTELP